MEFNALEIKEIKNTKFYYFVERIEACKSRDAILDWFTSRERPIINVPKNLFKHSIISINTTKDEYEKLSTYLAFHVPNNEKAYVKKMLDITPASSDYSVYGVIAPPDTNQYIWLLKLNENADEPPFRMYDRFYITGGMIKNYKDKQPLLTDVGKFFLNQLLLVYPFGELVPYLNGRFDPGKLDNLTAKLILDGKIGRKNYNEYMNNGYWYGESCNIATATWSLKSMTTDPNIKKRKQELLEKYKDQLDDPIVLTKIEDELIAMDKAWLANDSSAPFYVIEGSKGWNECRKKMYSMVGLGEGFSKGAGAYTLGPDSLEEGWQLKNLDIASNQVRRGSYGRGKETAKGGVQTKFVLRIFQDIGIMEEDCKSHDGIKTILTEDNIGYYYGRYLVDGTVISKENENKYLGKQVIIRSPMYCKTNGGFCYKCCGEIVKKLGINRIGMQALAITSSFVSIAMKAMHASTAKSTTIKNFYKFLR